MARGRALDFDRLLMPSSHEQEVDLTLVIEPDMEVSASQTASSVASFMGLDPDKADEVRIAVVEACINVIEHSAAQDGKVQLKFRVMPEYLQVEVRDRGIGFAPEEIEESRIEDKIHARRKRGWGLQIIRGLMDEVEVRSNDDGTTVIMRKKR